MEEDEDNSSTRKLFPGIPEDKRVGILRTFHHKMYEDEGLEYSKKKTCPQRCANYYCVENKWYGLIIAVAVALVIVGILSIVYGAMLPSLYETFDRQENAAIKSEDKIKADVEKEVFQITGIGMISFGLVVVVFGIFIPLYRDTANAHLDPNKDGVKTPILVDYEIAPYSLKPGYYAMSDSTSDYTPSPCASPVDNASFKTFYIQQEPRTR